MAGGTVGDSAFNAQLAGVVGQNAEENNVDSYKDIQDAKANSERMYKDTCAAYGLGEPACGNRIRKEGLEILQGTAMVFVPTSVYEIIPIGKGVGIVVKGTKKIVAVYKDAKSAEKAAEKAGAKLEASRKVNETSGFKGFSEKTKSKYFENITNQNFFENAKYTSKVNAQIQKDNYHGFPKTIDELARKYGKTSVYTGSKDAVPRLKLEIEGSYNGKKGIFEYMRNADGTINHRLFVPKKD